MESMSFEPLELAGAFLVSSVRHCDERGAFERVYCRDVFAAHGLQDCSRQNSLSHNTHRATLRGMHFQAPPHGETKLVRCVAGAIFDVLVDVRPGSATFGRWHGVELSARNGRALYIPRGFAHGFVTLTDGADVLYQIADPFVAGAASGFAWDDPDVGIAWPVAPVVIGDADRARPRLAAVAAHLGEGRP